MERTWRWFGKNDKITLAMLRQIGVEGIVTALHDVPLGEVWTREKIRDLREYIESYGMRWSVVESLPVVETIKYGGPDRDEQIEVYKESLCNLSAEGIHTIPASFGWSDLGSWGSLRLNSSTDDSGNATLGTDIHMFECEGCVVRTSSLKKVVLQGLEDYIVAEKDGSLLVCKLSEEQRIKDFSK